MTESLLSAKFTSLVVDTCLLVDAFICDSEFHDSAVSFLEACEHNNILLVESVTGMLEFQRTIVRPDNGPRLKKEGKWGAGYPKPGTENAITFKTIPIDENFVAEYMDIHLPYLKTGDFILLCIAKKEGIPLVTSDAKLLQKCKESGVLGLDYRNECDLKKLDNDIIGQ